MLTAQAYMESNLLCEVWTNIWPKIYLNVRKFTLDGYSRDFYYKLINNILQLNVSLFRAGFLITPLCSYCKTVNETTLHLFYECIHTRTLWRKLQDFFISDLLLPDLTPWSAPLGLPLICFDIEKHIHIIFLIAIYKNRAAGICSFNYLKNKILFTKKIELNLKYNSVKQRSFSLNK
jgi:hypothetical protein